MEFINKIGVLSLHILFLLDTFCCATDKLCKVPNGGAGTCVNITKCQPLNILYKKMPKTEKERLYIRQSMSQCYKKNVCCPPESEWSSFQPDPVMFPVSNRDKSPETVAAVPLLITGTASTAPKDPPETDIDLNPDTYFENRKLNFGASCGIDSSSANKIIGGGPTAIDAYPWLAILQYQFEFLGCGGSLITTKFVLTAAHCLSGHRGKPLFVRLSEYNITSYPIDEVETDGGGVDRVENKIVPVKDAFRHPNYNTAKYNNDIGLVLLTMSVQLNEFIKIICLPQVNYMPEFSVSTNFTLAGWGTANSVQNTVKVEVIVPFVSKEDCDQVQENEILDTQICAGGEEGKDSCNGDSGGPLMYERNQLFYAVGVVSFGRKACGTAGAPAVYTNVHKFLPWIHKVVNEN